jgi:hypothetical protein
MSHLLLVRKTCSAPSPPSRRTCVTWPYSTIRERGILTPLFWSRPGGAREAKTALGSLFFVQIDNSLEWFSLPQMATQGLRKRRSSSSRGNRIVNLDFASAQDEEKRQTHAIWPFVRATRQTTFLDPGSRMFRVPPDSYPPHRSLRESLRSNVLLSRNGTDVSLSLDVMLTVI